MICSFCNADLFFGHTLKSGEIYCHKCFNHAPRELGKIITEYKIKYKVGDEVKIRTWEEIQELSRGEGWYYKFVTYMSKEFEEKFPDRIVKVEAICGTSRNGYRYKMEDSPWEWAEEEIEGLAIFESIADRFEILDL